FDGKVVVVGDFRSTADRRPYADGRIIQLPYMHAAVIDSLLRNDVIRMPPLVNVLGPYVYAGYLFDGAAALAGAAIGLIFVRHRALGRIFVLVGLMALIGASIAAFHFGRMLFPPLLAMIALVVSCEIMFAAAR